MQAICSLDFELSFISFIEMQFYLLYKAYSIQAYIIMML